MMMMREVAVVAAAEVSFLPPKKNDLSGNEPLSAIESHRIESVRVGPSKQQMNISIVILHSLQLSMLNYAANIMHVCMSALAIAERYDVTGK